MILGNIFSPQTIRLNLESETKDEVFEELVEVLKAVHTEMNRENALNAVRDREAKMSTGIGGGIAVPHGQMATIKGVVGALGLSRRGIDYDALDKKPVHLVFLFLTGMEDCEYHLHVLNRLSIILEEPTFRQAITAAESTGDVWDIICRFDTQVDAAKDNDE